MKREGFISLFISFLLLASCTSSGSKGKDTETAISLLLERTIEIGEKYCAEQELIENVALTEGMDAAIRLSKKLHHQKNYDAFRNSLKETYSLLQQIPDTLERQVVLLKMKPYLNRLDEITTDNISFFFSHVGSTSQ